MPYYNHTITSYFIKRKRNTSMSKIDTIVSQSEKAFVAESARCERLTNKAEKYIAAVGAIVGFHLIEIKQLVIYGNSKEVIYTMAAISSFLFLFLALILSFIAANIYKYRSYPRGEQLINRLKDNVITDDIAKIKLAKMFLAAQETNGDINDYRAAILRSASKLIVFGFILTVIGHLVTLIK